MRDAQDDGRKALRIWRAHYAGTGKPRVISLYTELTSLVRLPHETVTDYVIRAETAATALKHAGETVTGSLLIAVEYKPFVVVVTQSEKEQNFSEFKVVLRSFEDTERASAATANHSVMKTEHTKHPNRISPVFNVASQGTLLVSVKTRARTDGDSGATRATTHHTVTEHVDTKERTDLTKSRRLLRLQRILTRKWSIHWHLKPMPMHVRVLLGSQMLYWWTVVRLLTSSMTSPNSVNSISSHRTGTTLS